MSNIKSLGQQSIQSTQSSPAEGPPKSAELVTENKPAEFRPLSTEQKKSIKLSRNAEYKLAESAIKAKTGDQFHSLHSPADRHVGLHHLEHDDAQSDIIKANDFHRDVNTPGADPSQTGPIVSQKMKDGIKELVGEEGGNSENEVDEPVLKAEKFFPSIRLGNPSRPDDLDSREEEQYDVAQESSKSKGENNLTESPIMAKESDSLRSDSVPKVKYGLKNAAFKVVGEAASKGLGSATVVKEAKENADIMGKDRIPTVFGFPHIYPGPVKPESEIRPELPPIDAFPTGKFPDVDDLKYGAKELKKISEKIKEAVDEE